MADYKGWGQEISQMNHCVTGLAHLTIVQSLVGYPYLEEKNTECMSNSYVSANSNIEAKTAIRESDFTRGRICGLNDCSGSDPSLNSTGLLEAQTMQVSCSNTSSRIINRINTGGVCTANILQNNFSIIKSSCNSLFN